MYICMFKRKTGRQTQGEKRSRHKEEMKLIMHETKPV